MTVPAAARPHRSAHGTRRAGPGDEAWTRTRSISSSFRATSSCSRLCPAGCIHAALVSGASGLAVGMATRMSPRTIFRDDRRRAIHLCWITRRRPSPTSCATFPADLPEGLASSSDSRRYQEKPTRRAAARFKTRAKGQIEACDGPQDRHRRRNFAYMVGPEGHRKDQGKTRTRAVSRAFRRSQNFAAARPRRTPSHQVKNEKLRSRAVLQQLYQRTPLEGSLLDQRGGARGWPAAHAWASKKRDAGLPWIIAWTSPRAAVSSADKV